MDTNQSKAVVAKSNKKVVTVQDATERREILTGISEQIIQALYQQMQSRPEKAMPHIKNNVIGLALIAFSTMMVKVVLSMVQGASNEDASVSGADTSVATNNLISLINNVQGYLTMLIGLMTLFGFGLAAYYVMVGTRITQQERNARLNKLKNSVAGVVPDSTRSATISFLDSLISIRSSLSIGSSADIRLKTALENSLLPLLLAGHVVAEIESYKSSRTPEQLADPKQQELLANLDNHENELKLAVQNAAREMAEFKNMARELAQSSKWDELNAKTNELLGNVETKAEDARRLLTQ